ncbi:MAG: DNA repair protein RecO [Phycisphaerae bacterium]|nr:DNA repair protein RecO [Phycisphaerae bacterium]
MALIKDEAVAIRRLDYSETSQVLAFFTREHGKQRLIAKGIKRGTKSRFATGIDLLERGSLVFSRKEESDGGLGVLTEWRQEDVFSGLRREFRWMVAGQYMAEAVDLTTEENDAAPRLYDELVRSFVALPNRDAPVLIEFQRALLIEIGLMPDLSRCVGCGRAWSGKSSPFFSAREGGLICHECEAPLVEKRRVDPSILLGLRGDRIGIEVAGEAFDLLDYHLTESLGRTLKTSPYVRQFLLGGASQVRS